MKHLPPTAGGPTKAFECALANELWMTDLMFGPTLKLASGKIIPTRLFALLDDCSRLVPHAQYYESEKLCWFLDCFRQGLARRGLPDKLYTDRGKIFTSYHLQIVCANLGVRLCHAKPYAAWSKGKMERWFRTLQMDFEARLVIDPARTLEELNARLWRWIEAEYHQRPHSALAGQTPAERFAQRALKLRSDPAHAGLGRVGYHLGPARDVTIFEDKAIVGGNLAGFEEDGVRYDVYPHIFGDWYRNFWALVEGRLLGGGPGVQQRALAGGAVPAAGSHLRRHGPQLRGRLHGRLRREHRRL